MADILPLFITNSLIDFGSVVQLAFAYNAFKSSDFLFVLIAGRGIANKLIFRLKVLPDVVIYWVSC